MPDPTPPAVGGDTRIRITALRDSKVGIDPATAFTLSLPDDMPLPALEKALSVFPKFGFRLNRQETGVVLTPEQKRRLATMINVTLLNVRFAGQAHFYPVEEPKEQSLSQPCG